MKFDYSDEVTVATRAQSGETKKRRGAIVGITSVETAEPARDFGFPVGSTLYAVEFGDGSDELVPKENRQLGARILPDNPAAKYTREYYEQPRRNLRQVHGIQPIVPGRSALAQAGVHQTRRGRLPALLGFQSGLLQHLA